MLLEIKDIFYVDMWVSVTDKKVNVTVNNIIRSTSYDDPITNWFDQTFLR